MQSDPDYPDYPNSEQVAQYLCSYVSHFGLDRFIRLGVNIEHLAPTKRSGQGGWSISLCDGQGAREEKYDRVLVTTGPFGRPFAPDIRGIEGFEGDVIHSRKYKG